MRDPSLAQKVRSRAGNGGCGEGQEVQGRPSGSGGEQQLGGRRERARAGLEGTAANVRSLQRITTSS